MMAVVRALGVVWFLTVCPLACANTVNGTSAGRDASLDAEASADVAEERAADVFTGPETPRTPGTCAVATDCDEPPPDDPSTPRMNPAWSCIAGQCVYETHGGRTCSNTASGCLDCGTDAMPVCPGARCLGLTTSGFLASYRTLAAACTRPDFAEVMDCFGEFARLRDGSTCTLRYAPTGAPIVLLACRACTTQLRQGP